MKGSNIVRFVRWTRQIIRPVQGRFILGTAGEIGVTYAQLVQTQLFASIVAMLAAAGTANPDGAETPWFIPDTLGGATVMLFILLPAWIIADNLVKVLNAGNDILATRSLQHHLHDRLLSVGASWHDQRDPAEGAEVVGNIARGTVPIMVQTLKFPIVQGVGLIGAMSLLYYNLGNLPDTSVALRLFVILAILALPVAAWWVSRRLRLAQEAVLAADRRVSTEVLNSLSQPMDIRALGGEASRSATVGAALGDSATARRRVSAGSVLRQQLTTATPIILQALLLAYGVYITVTAADAATIPAAIAAIIAIYQLVPRIIDPVMALINFLTGIGVQWPTIERVGLVLDAEPDAAAPANPQPWPANAREVSLRDVTFAYTPDGRRILEDVSHAFRPGALTAVVGRSGSGKSTIMQLVARLRAPLSGAVTLGQTPIAAIANGTLREKVGVVSQFAPILTDTVRANFQLLKADATDAEIEAVSRRTGFWDVLLRKDAEKPLDQPMQREVGRGFSGGERRLLAITRLLLRDPEIILFDEPTTGIDAQSLEPVKAAMLAAAKDRTAILVEHDLALVRALADEVCVLENGRFVQVGPPAKLAAEAGPFRDLLDARERLVATESAMTIESFPVPQLPPKGGPAAGAPKIAPGTMKKGVAP